MPAYIVVQISVKDPARYERYRELVPATIAAYGGRYLVRGGRMETLEGTWNPPRLAIVEFPTAERAKAWWSSAEYADVKPIRLAHADSEMLLVEGV